MFTLYHYDDERMLTVKCRSTEQFLLIAIKINDRWGNIVTDGINRVIYLTWVKPQYHPTSQDTDKN